MHRNLPAGGETHATESFAAVDIHAQLAKIGSSRRHDDTTEQTMSHTIAPDLVRTIGKLSRIELTDEEVPRLAGELGAIIEYFDKLQQLDTDGVEPMPHAIELRNVLAADELGESLDPDEALANAPARDGDYFKVPKVIGESS
jgi:aspartyl-tRNA(Asn)/glutamyl-tRNA(Gln) amidotransferase subunit C